MTVAHKCFPVLDAIAVTAPGASCTEDADPTLAMSPEGARTAQKQANVGPTYGRESADRSVVSVQRWTVRAPKRLENTWVTFVVTHWDRITIRPRNSILSPVFDSAPGHHPENN
jgi:hypothetical protein